MECTVDEMNKCLDTWYTLLLQNNMLKFFEDLFGHVLMESEGLYYTSGLSYLPLVIPLYQKNIGRSIIRILTVAGAEIDQFFESIKEKIQVREDLKTFLARLVDKFLCGSPQHELYFLTVASRIFALTFKADRLSSDIFTEEVVETIIEHASRIEGMESFSTSNIEPLIVDILKNSNSIDEFRNLKCGVASDYFSS